MADTIRHHKKRAFLAAYARCGTVTQAATLADVHRSAHYEWLKEDEAYVEAFAAAKEEAGEWLEAEARRRAFLGILKAVHYKGERVDYVREYSDTLLIFLLKGAMPAKYRERHEITIDHVALRSEAERIAKENDLPVEEVVAEAERIAKGVA